MKETVIVSFARTPFGSFLGSIKDVSATDLGALVIREAVSRAGIEGGSIDYALMGMVVQAGAGQIPSRQATIKAGLPVEVPSDTIGKVCASSLRAVNLGDSLIRAGDAEIVLAGGMENMSATPYLMEKARTGYRMGDGKLVDAMVRDGLWCAIHDVHMGVHGGDVADEFGIGREPQDEWALRSHELAVKAIDEGKLQEEIVPVSVPQRKGDPIVFDTDELPRRNASLEALAKLPPVFKKGACVTAGNAPPISDGASALVLMSREKAEQLGVKPLASIVSQGAASAKAPYIATVPALAGKKALEKAGMTADQLDLIEVNEAFAAVALTSIKLGGWNPDAVNVNGGAIAYGHPIGASGGRILMTLLTEMKRRSARYGMATICSGAAQGEATIIKLEE
ncbi:acetyl-CoA C-acetyltransferase [Dethiobacter alkaliphilus]|uniref:acetyl-CoA C-acetyltransferase n=1 Tax=Dethiobacter alkaliphilus AHT 1 TaxID=555088 RepID=C0GKS0_DETAL|nr:acetyl-CoA C-acetyltransferase [Dethiobacter alkaliphilus]EEG76092.1 acetyl-CoA acetyltransferase [Dethiobacter alkaliphilus AHT 1]